ncbi:GAF and ANTAR domain-containing protein [Salsipaludibacter albus]|uniref:GAF and ANTAR domain-containing protein n=1 Tax=Salsipaludibacter albus TaxID=2849650 RepID=UPI001EE4D022|nr:GAF and ANTAR domain-containing protein [Salsipaludibacter albus]MBY5163266.1 GAF and ANTAR domain-containing protein [Salsipaludibacter albus]
MVDHDALFTAMTAYADAMLGPYRVGEVLYRLSDQAVRVLGVEGAGVLVVGEDGSLGFAAATDERVAHMEATQEAGDQGPCHDAFHQGAPVVVPDLGDEQRWPVFRRVALQEGCQAVAGLPMPARADRVGALNLYHLRPHAWTDEELQVGQLLANLASGYILHHVEMSDSRDVVGQLRQALDSRVVIEQAKGIVAARRGVAPSAAFDLLRTRARSTQTVLHTLCQQVVDGVDPGPPAT